MSLRGPILALALVAGCGGSSTRYAYFKVQVSMDPTTVDDDRRREIIGCGVRVTGAVTDSFNLPHPCTKGSVPYELGKFEYATTADKGELTFTISMTNIGRKTVATGSSDPVTILPDMTVDTVVVVKGMPDVDGGAPDDGAPDGGAPD